nr:reverse transcriptase domain-containing protein [Tanacetum cinerariifolium]
MAPKRTSTSAAPAMNQAAIRQLIDDRVAAALEAQAANIANTDNTNRNPEPRETHAARKCTYKEFMSCQPFYFNGTEGAVRLIRWFERIESVFSRSNCIEDCKVKFSSVKKMEDEFYNLVTKRNDLKTYARRFQELEVLCPNMVPNTEKFMEVIIGGLPKSIEGNVTTLKPQTLEEAINITQRLMDQHHDLTTTFTPMSHTSPQAPLSPPWPPSGEVAAWCEKGKLDVLLRAQGGDKLLGGQGGDRGACGLVCDMGVKVVVRSWCLDDSL